MPHLKLDVVKLALAAGLCLGIYMALGTACAVLGIPGYPPFGDLMAQFYGPWGYSVSWPGVFVGALWGFVEGVVLGTLLAAIYNRLLARG